MPMIYEAKKIRAILPPGPTQGGSFAKRDLPDCTTRVLVAATRFQPLNLIQYESRMGASRGASTVHGFLWVRRFGDGVKPLAIKRGESVPFAYTNSGTGKAGGYGYHKDSAAFQECLNNAGIILEGRGGRLGEGRTWQRLNVGGGGSSCIDAALYAIGESLGFSRERLLVV